MCEGGGVNWKWITGPLKYSDRCAGCAKGLFGDPQIVQWRDDKLYHVGCLLDRLENPPPEPVSSVWAESGYSWMSGGIP